MPRVIAIQGGADLDDSVREAVASLQSGQIIGLPGSTTYCAAVFGSQDEKVVSLRERFGSVRIALRDGDQTLDFVPDLAPRVHRLLRRCWPGPLVVRVSGHAGAAKTLSETVRAALTDGGSLAFWCPASVPAQTVLSQVGECLLMTGDGGSAPRLTSAEALIAAYPDCDVVLDAGPVPYNAPASVIQVTTEGFETVSSGILSDQAMNVSACCIYLFVCTGNTCRSPLAEGLFRKLLAERLQCEPDELVARGYLVQSAGLAAASGSPASPESVKLLRDRDVDLSGHASQPLTEQLLETCDHIFTMTRGHRDSILRVRPGVGDRVHVLRRDGGDVVDPIGGGMGEYQRCEREIEDSLRAIIESHLTRKES